MRLHRTALALALTCSVAGATSLDFGVSYAPAGGTLGQDGLLRVGVTDLPFAGFSLMAGAGSRSLDASLGRSLVLPGLGVARVRADGAFLYGGGLRGGLTLGGTAGPVALTLSGSVWNAGAARFDPLARWAEVAPDLRDSGGSFGVTARYRLNREVVLNVNGTVSAQSSVLAQAEWRQDLLSYRAGVRAGQDVLGVTGGVTYADPDSGLNAALDALVGPDTLGLTGHVGLDGVLGDGSSVRVYAAYEPWRTTSEVLRIGAQAGLPVGPGTLNVEAYGGSRGSLTGLGYGVKVGFSLPLDPPADGGDAPTGSGTPDGAPGDAAPTDAPPAP
ncbi:hypothetical protein [Deinococcus aquiradiocola]|uniref:Cellulose biosynthesis protein BcsS n=1 Tax=Deinococcus aquiradiocola TaxID=393059 RepID=A0A917PDM9_9DEIO|nr:hypothetical protein [Deinococcus aquiradiocola]GGJ72043.1 hypothetical protein GCM10008939_15540 [Deinococcus aquiradiocola]